MIQFSQSDRVKQHDLGINGILILNGFLMLLKAVVVVQLTFFNALVDDRNHNVLGVF